MYSNHNDKTQTIKSSGCGPTSAAMCISASKGITTPPVMAQLFNDNGMRTYSNGTAWNAWPFIADYFDFSFYEDTTNFKEVSTYLKQDKNNDGISDYFAILSCGSGLFTTGGHYVFSPGWDFEKQCYIIYDPYYYPGKFNTISRKAANVKVEGNVAYITESSLQKYGAVKHYWIYSNDSGTQKTKTTTKSSAITSSKTTTKTMYVNTKTDPLNVRTEPKQSATKVRQLARGSKVTVYETKNGWSRIATNEWVNSSYLSSTKPSANVSYKTTIGNAYKLSGYTYLYSKGTLSGTSYYYKPNTKVVVKNHYSSTVDYIYVPATGRYAYVKVSNLK